ncbi:hypothetical protein [Chamaesiphon sp.]|uniref:hypothetical protein n=1 Tax=Chamaesiphon sp. TaxID=2814140 RepID=UPI00359349BD
MSLFLTVINIDTPADAQSIARLPKISMGSRAKVVESLPSVTDLNLTVPVSADVLSPQDRKQVDSIVPFWSRPRKNNSSTTVPKIKTNGSKIKTKNTGISKTSLNVIDSKAKSKLINQRSSSTSPDSLSISIAKNNQKAKPSSRRLAVATNLQMSGNYLRLVRDVSQGTNDIGNPIYTLEAYVDGQRYQTFSTVSGTVNTQTSDRHIGNNSAPLPDGLYEVSNQIIPGNIPEVGKTFISIFPKFGTRRSDLGIHLDPSFNQRNGYDGTAGCIGMTTTADRDAINEFVAKYQPRNLFVKIAISADRE